MPMPAVVEPEMLGPELPSPIVPWQLSQPAEVILYAVAPRVGSPTSGAAPALPLPAPALLAPACPPGAPAALEPAAPVAPAPPPGVLGSVLEHAEIRAATAAPRKQTVAKRCKVLKTESFSLS